MARPRQSSSRATERDERRRATPNFQPEHLPWELGVGSWELAMRRLVSAASAGALGRFDLLERVFDEALIVFLRHIPLQDLRRNGNRQIDGLGTDLLEGARGF